jgi:LacI family transcriptional regulator
VLFDNPSPNYNLRVQEGAYLACREGGFQLIIEHVDTHRGDAGIRIREILDHGWLDGIIVTPPATDCAELLDVLEETATPCVRIAPMHWPDRFPIIFSDDEAASHAVARYLWSLGHRTFGFVGGPPEHGASRWRRVGFESALTEKGVAEGGLCFAEGDFTFASGIGAGLELLRRDEKPTAIFAANDDMACGVCAAAAQLGIKVPEAISVIGFDDSLIAKNMWPELTTVHQPIAEMAAEAVRLLIGRKFGRARRSIQHKCTFIARGTTAPPNR